MGKAAGSAQDFGKKAEDAGKLAEHSMTDSRESVMLLGDELGIHMPRALSMFISKLGPVAGLMETAFPIIGIVAVIGIIGKLIEQHHKLKDELEQTANAQMTFGTDAVKSLQSLDDKLLEAGIKTDELNHNHLGALHKQLELIDHASMRELDEEFGVLAKAADAAFATMKASWYQFGEGSEGAKHAMDEFKVKYDSLVAQGRGAEAHDLLAGTLKSAQAYLSLQDKLRASHGVLVEEAVAYARANGKAVDTTERTYQAQRQLVEVLNDQVTAEGKINELRNAKVTEARTDEAKKVTADNDKLVESNKAVAESYGKLMELALAYGKHLRELPKASADGTAQVEDIFKALADTQKKSAQERLQVATQGFANQAEVAKTAFEQEKGAITNAVDTGLITRKVATQEEIALIQREFGVRMAALGQEVAAKRAAVQAEIDADNRAASQTLAVNGGDKSDPKYIAYLGDAAVKMAQLDALTTKYNADVRSLTTTEQTQVAGLNTQLGILGKNWADYFQKMKSETSDLALTINTTLQGSITKFTDGFANAISKSIVEGKSLGKEMRNVGKDILEGMISTLVRWVEQWIISHTIMAAVSASSAAQQLATGKLTASVLAGANGVASFAAAPWPVDMGAPAFGASMAAAALAFADGGLVPGSGTGDTVPAMLSPGETVVSRALTEQVKNNTTNNRGGDTHNHISYSPQIHAVDAEGVDRLLTKHASTFQRHMVSTVRKMNKR